MTKYKAGTRDERLAAAALDRDPIELDHDLDFMSCKCLGSQDPLDTLLLGRRVGMMHMGNSNGLPDLTVYGRQEAAEDSPAGWPQQPKDKHYYRNDGRPITQWPRLKAVHSDDLGRTMR